MTGRRFVPPEFLPGTFDDPGPVKHDVVAITDEIYEHLAFDGRGLVRFAFPKKDETLDAAEERFKKLPA